MEPDILEINWNHLPYKKEQLVRLVGLKNSKWNEKTCNVLDFDLDKKRYIVEMNESGEVKAIKMKNLIQVLTFPIEVLLQVFLTRRKKFSFFNQGLFRKADTDEEKNLLLGNPNNLPVTKEQKGKEFKFLTSKTNTKIWKFEL